jgi:hypothetical protein
LVVRTLSSQPNFFVADDTTPVDLEKKNQTAASRRFTYAIGALVL